MVFLFLGVATAATRGPLESTTKIVPGAVTFQNTEAMTKVRLKSRALFLYARLKYPCSIHTFSIADVQR